MNSDRSNGETIVEPSRPATKNSAGAATDDELVVFLRDWADKAERERRPTATVAYQWGIDGLREAANRLEQVNNGAFGEKRVNISPKTSGDA